MSNQEHELPNIMPGSGSGRRLQPDRLKRGASMHGWNGDRHRGWMGIWWILSAASLAVVVWALLKSARRRAPLRQWRNRSRDLPTDVDGSPRLGRTETMTTSNRKAI